ncbi:MAG: hypothetical protein RIA63_03455 [Cyclobacteriaceae bacterium]
MGKPQFEDSWRSAFDGAETDVPDSVWSKIEVDLIRAENKGNKSMVVLYQRIAAGIALFALSLAGYIAYDRVTEGSGQIAQQNVVAVPQELNEALQESSTLKDQVAEKNVAPQSTGKSMKQGTPNQATSLAVSSTQSNASLVEKDSEAIPQEQILSHRERLAYSPDLSSWTPSDVKLHRTKFYEPNFPRPLPAMPSYFMASNDEKKDRDSFYAGLGLAGGSYNPGGISASQSNALAIADPNGLQSNDTPPRSSQASTGSAYSMGISMGKKVGNRLVIQTGLSYLNQSIDYTANYATASSNRLSAAVADYSDLGAEAISYVSPYTIRSAVEFLAIPLQAGYQFVDRKLGLQLNAGVSTDFFLKNTLRDESGQSDDFSKGAGEDSPYRTVNWSGLTSVELSYKLADRYSMSIVPGFRYSFNSILKDESALAYRPLVLDVGLRIKYIFK